MTKIHFGLVGCGRISRKHASAISRGEESVLAAVCDIDADRARALASEYDVPWFTSMKDMVQAGIRLDVLNILTPSGLHAQHCIEAASYGKHVVVEKPMALRLSDADAMIRACDEARVRLFVVKQNRYNPPVQNIKSALDEGRFGKLCLGTARVRWCRTQKYYDQDKWRGTWALDGGVLANQASHHIDLLEWFMGDVESVSAKIATQLVNIEVEDTAVVILKFTNGALGVIEATTATRPLDLEGSVSVLGEKGTAVVGGFAANEMVVWNFAERKAGDDNVIASTKTKPTDVYGFGHSAYMQNVVECIKANRAALVDGIEGRRSLELISAIYESAATGKEVHLRFSPRHSPLGQSSTRV